MSKTAVPLRKMPKFDIKSDKGCLLDTQVKVNSYRIFMTSSIFFNYIIVWILLGKLGYQNWSKEERKLCLIPQKAIWTIYLI